MTQIIAANLNCWLFNLHLEKHTQVLLHSHGRTMTNWLHWNLQGSLWIHHSPHTRGSNNFSPNLNKYQCIILNLHASLTINKHRGTPLPATLKFVSATYVCVHYDEPKKLWNWSTKKATISTIWLSVTSIAVCFKRGTNFQ